jgi:hypothetical protein
MKLPLEFNIKLIFRLVFAGVILATALFPATRTVADAFGIKIGTEFLFPGMVILWGWAVLICDMRIYMLFEGRRHWPDWIRKPFISSETRRLTRLEKIILDPEIGRRRYLEAGVELSLFPITDDSTYYVAHPTRLGNLIESFETYPKIKYGLDSVFFWYRLWVVLDKDIREEIESAQSIVDSTIYVTFALYVSGITMFGYAGAALLTQFGHAYLNSIPLLSFPYVPGPVALLAFGSAYLVAGYGVYRLSLTAHAQFGELFKSIFDQFRSKLQLDDVLKEIASINQSHSLPFKSRREKNQMIWRYLHWHLVRDDDLGRNLTVKEWRARSDLR